MSNVLSEEKRQQVIALGRLGWPLRRIEQETGVRRETAGAYLKAAGIAVRPPGGWGRRPPAKPAKEVTTGSDTVKQELGLGHYEGRGWRGFHHHATLCIAAYGFLVAERSRFSPSARAGHVDLPVPEMPPQFRPRGSPSARGAA